uniref:Uncharacterized protein n=1 Tax=Myotis myotis TaxID=51298 RepID=A0A7J7Y0G6_MYOMY|nr:hypothetical protein mMyoMyo1_011495 [Myotis myotis]
MEMKKKKAGVVILISDKIEFKVKAIIRDNEGHCIILKGSIQQEDITLVNIYAPNTGASRYIKKTKKKLLEDFKGEIDSNTIIVRDSNTPLTSLNRSSRQKINKETVTLNNTLDQMALIDIFRIITPKLQNIHSSQVHMDIFKDTPHVRIQTKFLQVQEDISSMFSDHNEPRNQLQ